MRDAPSELRWAGRLAWWGYDAIVPVAFDRSIAKAFQRLDLPRGGHALDAGCGSGRSLLPLQDWLRSGGRLTGFDRERTALDAARARARALGVEAQTTWTLADLTAPEPVGRDFDGAVAHFSIYALGRRTDRQMALSRISAALKPGARLVCAVPGQGYRADALAAIARRQERARTDIPRSARWIRANVMNRLLVRQNRLYLDPLLDRDVLHRYGEEDLLEDLAAAGLAEISVQVEPDLLAYHGVGRRP